ncbi:MAG: hypothetical protein LC794_19110 [Acidobacteria bacterium]|nr:hypothetical protein [Acidobacteriota bacterium]
MALFILEDAAGIGNDQIDTFQAFIDCVIIANDDGVGLNDPAGGRQQVTYARTENGPPQLRLDALVNTTFTPDYGSGPQQVDTVVIPGLAGFTLDDGTDFRHNGTALAPNSSGLAGASLNTTEFCLVIYDTQQNICVARQGSGDIDLPISNPVVLYHEFSHAFRIVNNGLLALTGECDPSSPEENAAITDENDLRTQIANRQGETPALRDPGIHCGAVGCDGGCCIIATVASKSLNSKQIQFLRSVRDHFVRSTEVGYAFFQKFFYDYYSFSPQVCTIMVGNPEIPGHLLEGYINPLLDFWKVMIERSGNNFSDAELGAAFVRHHPDRAAAQSRLEALQSTVAYWMQEETEGNSAPAELLTLLRERAWPSEYMQWALVAPVRIYHDVLTRYLAGADEAAIGRAFNNELDTWAPEIPISDVWAALSAEEVVKELEFCENVLLQSPASKKRFHQRLLDRFADITSVDVVLNGLTANAGVVQ